jgi:hypothetical protein
MMRFDVCAPELGAFTGAPTRRDRCWGSAPL